MTGEGLSFEDLSKELLVTVQKGRDTVDGTPATDIRVNAVPPFSQDEHIELMEKVGPDSDAGSELVAAAEVKGVTIFSMDGEPGERHVNVAELLAREIALLRGLGGAAFVDSTGEAPVEKIVTSNS